MKLKQNYKIAGKIDLAQIKQYSFLRFAFILSRIVKRILEHYYLTNS